MNVFEENLKKQTEWKMKELKKDISKAITGVLKRHGVRVDRTLPVKYIGKYEFGLHDGLFVSSWGGYESQ